MASLQLSCTPPPPFVVPDWLLVSLFILCDWGGLHRMGWVCACVCACVCLCVPACVCLCVLAWVCACVCACVLYLHLCLVGLLCLESEALPRPDSGSPFCWAGAFLMTVTSNDSTPIRGFDTCTHRHARTDTHAQTHARTHSISSLDMN